MTMVNLYTIPETHKFITTIVLNHMQLVIYKTS